MEYSNSQAREVIENYLHNERDRGLMCDRLINGYTIERLAEKYELSVSQVKRIITRDSEIIFRHVK